ncbi:MAG: EamA family transporter [Alphaproteobacteria bacterium]
MTTTVFFAVICAALLHAIWNALVKSGVDKHLSMTAVVLGHAPIALIVAPFVPSPTLESWPFLFAGIGLHVGYQIFLLHSYKIGDLTQVYPIARGSAPLLVAAVSVLFLGVQLQSIELIAVLVIGGGIISMSLVRQNDGLRNSKAAMLALITGCFIAAYSLVDGTGARIAGTALGFYSWLAIGNAVVFAGFTAITKPGMLAEMPIKAKKVFLVGGSASFGAYALVIWAFTQAPIALVTALREISIVFALLIGVFFLKEKLNLAKVFSTMVTLLGVALLRFSKQ